MWKKYIDQDWFKEEPELYESEVIEVCEKLNCTPEEIYIITSDDEYELVEEITKGISGNFSEYKGQKVYSTYADGGLVSVYSKIKF